MKIFSTCQANKLEVWDPAGEERVRPPFTVFKKETPAIYRTPLACDPFPTFWLNTIARFLLYERRYFFLPVISNY